MACKRPSSPPARCAREGAEATATHTLRGSGSNSLAPPLWHRQGGGWEGVALAVAGSRCLKGAVKSTPPRPSPARRAREGGTSAPRTVRPEAQPPIVRQAARQWRASSLLHPCALHKGGSRNHGNARAERERKQQPCPSPLASPRGRLGGGGFGYCWFALFEGRSEEHPSPARPARRRSLRSFIRPHASGVQAAFFTPCALRKGGSHSGSPNRPASCKGGAIAPLLERQRESCAYFAALRSSMYAFTCCSSTGSGTEPRRRMVSWKPLMSNLSPSSFSACARSLTMVISPSL